MVYAISKAFWWLFNPAMLTVTVLAVGIVLSWTRWRRLGRWCVTVAGMAIAVFWTLPIGAWMLEPLEARFPVPALPAEVDGVIVLSGGEGRMPAFRRLVDAYPDAQRVFSGRYLAEDPADTRPVRARIRALLEQYGVDPDGVTIEDGSRTTCESARVTQALLRPAPGEAWILVTSAYHMPRSVACFRTIGWDVIPYPTDYQSEAALAVWDAHDLARMLRITEFSSKEWVGLLGYRLSGETAMLFPGPRLTCRRGTAPGRP